MLSQARRAEPGLLVVLESLGLAHIRAGEVALASSVADTLLMSPQGQAGGSLIKMVLAHNANDRVGAREFFESFVQSGKDRSDYSRIVEYYGSRVF